VDSLNRLLERNQGPSIHCHPERRGTAYHAGDEERGTPIDAATIHADAGYSLEVGHSKALEGARWSAKTPYYSIVEQTMSGFLSRAPSHSLRPARSE